MKTAKITLDSIKCTDGWYEVGIDLGFNDKEIRHTKTINSRRIFRSI